MVVLCTSPGKHHRADAPVGEDFDEWAVRDTPVDDVGARHTAVDCPQAGFHLGHHAGLQSGQHLAQCIGADLRDHLRARRPVGIETGHVGEHHELLSTKGDGERCRSGVGIHIVRGAGGIGSNG